jgi:hypothetical protein
MVAISLTMETYSKLLEYGEPDQVIYVILNTPIKSIPSRSYGRDGMGKKETKEGYKIINIKNTTKAILDNYRKQNNSSYSSVIQMGMKNLEDGIDIPVKCTEYAQQNKDISHAVSDLVWTEGFEYNMYLYKHQYNKIPTKYLNVLRKIVGQNYLNNVKVK